MHEPLKKESGAHAHAALAARVGTVLKEKWRLDKLLGVDCDGTAERVNDIETGGV